MSRLEEIKTFCNVLPVRLQDKGASLSDVIDVIIEDIRNSDDLRTSAGKDATLTDKEIGERITHVQVRRSGGVTMSIRWDGRLGHGPLEPWIPHTCHKTIELCWPGPEGSGMDVCLEIEFPWPCNPPWPLPGPD